MKNRKNYLKARKKQFYWNLIGCFSNYECPKCGQKTMMQIYQYDACCCITCNEWLEKPCSDPDCPFCSKRPLTPYEAYYNADLEIGSADRKKNWRRENYQHKMDGLRRHKRKREWIEDILRD